MAALPRAITLAFASEGGATLVRTILLLVGNVLIIGALATACGGGTTYWSAAEYADQPVYGTGTEQGVSNALHEALATCGLADEDAVKAVRVFQGQSIEGLVVSTDVKGLVGFRDLEGTDKIKWFNVKGAGSGVFEVTCSSVK